MLELIRARLAGEPAGQGRDPAGDPLARLAPGRVVSAEVAGQESGGLVRLRLMGQELLAETQAPLRPGQRLTLTVMETKPQLVLSLGQGQAAPAGAGGAARLAQALAALMLGRQRLTGDLAAILGHDPQKTPPPTPRAAELMAQAQDLARQVALDQDAAGDPAYLRRLMGAAGMDLMPRLARLLAGGGETLPASLRTLLPALTRELGPHLAQLTLDQPERAAALRQFLAAAEGLAESFAANQRLNAELLPKEALLFLGLPLMFGDELRQGELLLGLPQAGGQDGGGETSLVFFLDLTALGPLTIEARIKDGLLRGRFLAADAERAAFLDDLLPELAERLAGLGLAAELVTAARPGPDQAEDAPLAQMLKSRGHYLSLTV
ncbi:MAG: flagellar hook-length control protein FliK [Thermodesulfobacteriota bacterium]